MIFLREKRTRFNGSRFLKPDSEVASAHGPQKGSMLARHGLTIVLDNSG